MKKTAYEHYVYTDNEAAKWYRRVLYFAKDFWLFALAVAIVGGGVQFLLWEAPPVGQVFLVIFSILFAVLFVMNSRDGKNGFKITLQEILFYPDRRSLTPLTLEDWKVLKARAEHHPDVLALLAAAMKEGRTIRGRDFEAIYRIVERRREQKRKVLNAEKEAADRLAEQQAEAAAVAEIQQSLQDAHARAGEKA